MKPMREPNARFMEELQKNQQLAESRGLRLWYTTFGSTGHRQTVHAKIFAGDVCLMQWWPSKGTWISFRGERGKCSEFADLVTIAASISTKRSEKKEQQFRQDYNVQVEESVVEWRKKMIAADHSTEPPFDAVQLPGETYAAFGPVGCPKVRCPKLEDVSGLDAEFKAIVS